MRQKIVFHLNDVVATQFSYQNYLLYTIFNFFLKTPQGPELKSNHGRLGDIGKYGAFVQRIR